MKHPLFTRSVSLLLAVLMVLSLPAAAIEVSGSLEPASSAADDGQVETTPLSPFDDSQDTVLPADEAPAAQDPQQAEMPAAAVTPVYFDDDGNYLAPAELVLYVTAYIDPDKKADINAQDQYTGIVAFYDYNETDPEKMLEQPYFFYYEKGVLQDEEPLFFTADRYLSLPSAPTQEDEEQTVYLAEEVYIDPEAEEHPSYLFAFNQEKADNGLYTGEKDGLAYEDGLIPAVHITGVTQNSSTGGSPTLTWGKLADAQSYQIYRRTDPSQAWGDPIGTVNAGTNTYTDSTAAEVGTTYFYQVRAVYSNGSLSGDTGAVSYTCRAIPQVTVKSAAGGPLVSWNQDPSATGYRIFRRPSAGGSWVTTDLIGAGESSKLQWQDTGAQSNQTYVYTVRAYYGDTAAMAGNKTYTTNLWSGYKISASLYYLAAPVMGVVNSGTTGMVLHWAKVDGATGYRVYRKAVGETSWTLLTAKSGPVSALTYTDQTAKAGGTYFYTIRAVNAQNVPGPYYDYSTDVAQAFTYHGVPAVTLKNGVGLVVSWSKDTTATGYRVFRKAAGDKSWTIVANLTKNVASYTDTTAVSGTSYTYTVRAYYGDAAGLAADKNYNTNLWSSYKASSALIYGAPPVLGDVYSATDSMRVTWTAAKGAVGYIVYRRASTETSYTNLGRVTSGSTTYFVDKTVKADTAYLYTVRAAYKDANGKEYLSGYYNPTITAVYHATPTVKVTPTADGNVVTWSLDPKATGYRVYCKIEDGENKSVANIEAASLAGATQGRYTDSNLTNGTKYTYTIRAYYGTGTLSKTGYNYSNDWSGAAVKSVIFLTAPVLSSTATMTTSGIKISWTKVPSAASYRVYRRQNTTDSWTKIADISSGATEVYLDTSKLSSGSTYYYTVRAVASDKTSLSSYDTTGVLAAYLPAPALESVLCSSSGTTVKWKAVSGATGYMVYRKTSSGSWTLLATTTGASTLSYKDTAVKNKNTTYYYTVKAYKTVTVSGKQRNFYGAYESGMTFSITMSGSGWVKKDSNTYYVKDGICVVGWQYLTRNGSTYKYYFDPKTGALVTNLYSYFGKSYRNLKCRVVVCINTSNSNPSYNTIYLYDSETDSYCIPAVSVRCVGNPTKTTYKSKSAYIKAGAGQRWLDSGSFEQYATYISGTYSWFHSALYFGSKSPNSFSSASYNSLVNNNNNSNGCIRMQCIYAFLIQDIMKNGYGKSNRVPVVLYKNTSNAGPFGVPKVDKISSRKTDPTDPAVTGKFFYETSIWGVNAKSGASAWTYY